MLRYTLLTTMLLACLYSRPQALSENTSVSLITCGPGADLYSTFGHTAIHIYDRQTGTDRIYNYGTFDFDTPNFYLKFAQGKLNYQLSVSTLERFVLGYQYEGRWVYRQELNLSMADIEALYAFLENNALPQNKDYKYDFFYDNCSTRPRDVFETVLGARLTYSASQKDTAATFRDMIDLYLTNHYWSRLGIYLALGVPCDHSADYRQKMFLPDYLMSAFASASVMQDGTNVPFVKKEGLLLKENPALQGEKGNEFTWVFWAFFGCCLFATLLGNPMRMRWFDVFFFGLIGFLGICLVLLWFATDHTATKWNLNILWALPSWMYGAWLLARGRTNSAFFKWHAAILFFAVVAWMWLPQRLHPAAIPLVLSLMARSWAWQKKKFTELKST